MYIFTPKYSVIDIKDFMEHPIHKPSENGLGRAIDIVVFDFHNVNIRAVRHENSETYFGWFLSDGGKPRLFLHPNSTDVSQFIRFRDGPYNKVRTMYDPSNGNVLKLKQPYGYTGTGSIPNPSQDVPIDKRLEDILSHGKKVLLIN